MRIARQAKAADAVDDAEVDGLGRAAHLRGDLVHGHAMDLRGRAGMDVLPAPERVAHGGIAAHVRQHAQLDLAVIRVQQHVPLARHKGAADLAPLLGTDGDILQIGLQAGDTARDGGGLVKGGMHAPVAAAQLGQALDIGALQLGHPAVAKQRLDHGVIGRKPLQHLGGGGVTTPAFLLRRGQAKLVKEHLAQLLGAVKIELSHARIGVNGGTAFLDLAAEPGAQLTEHVLVHQKADPLHVEQHAGKRLLHVVKQRLQAARLQALALPEVQRVYIIGGRGLERRSAMLGAHRKGQGIVLLRGVQQVGGNHGVVFHGGQRQAVAVQKAPHCLGAMHHKGRRRKQLLQRTVNLIVIQARAGQIAQNGHVPQKELRRQQRDLVLRLAQDQPFRLLREQRLCGCADFRLGGQHGFAG